MTTSITCTSLFSDAQGESLFEDIELDLSSAQFAPPAPALDVADLIEATNIF